MARCFRDDKDAVKEAENEMALIERISRAEARVAELEAESKRLRKCVVIACRSGKFVNPEAAAAKIIERSFPREEAKRG